MSITTFSGPVASQNGFIENSFTTAERDAIVDPQTGLLIYNTTTNTYEVYNGTSWQDAFAAPIVLPLPNVTTFTPTSGPTAGGTTLTVSGSNFLFNGAPNVNAALLQFPGGIQIGITNINVISDTEFTCQTGQSWSGAVTGGRLYAYNADNQNGTRSSSTFDYTSATTYTQGTDYTAWGTYNSTSDPYASVPSMTVMQTQWLNSTGFNTVIAKGAGTIVNITYANGSTQTTTLASGFLSDPTQTYRYYAQLADTPTSAQVTSFSI